MVGKSCRWLVFFLHGEPPHPPLTHEIHFRGYKLWNNAESLGHYKYMDDHSPAAIAPRLKGEIYCTIKMAAEKSVAINHEFSEKYADEPHVLENFSVDPKVERRLMRKVPSTPPIFSHSFPKSFPHFVSITLTP